MGLEPRFHGIPHTAGTLTVEFVAGEGFEGGDNESFGIDNLEVVVGFVHEPSSPMLLSAGVAGGIMRRFRRARPA